MCGIAGQLQSGGTITPEALSPVLDRLTHRGPNHRQTWVSGRVAFGHTRLSILDLSENAHQPMVDPATGNCIVLNGEIYNFGELRENLRAAGHRFRSTGDTEVLLKLYAERGKECLSLLRGMFAFAIWDEQRQHLFIARDRLGKKPFFYALTSGGLVFASEVRALAAHPDVSNDVDFDAVDLFLSTGCIPSPYSVFRSIRKLPPATYGVFNSNGLTTGRYWELNYTQKSDVSEEEALEMLSSTLEEAIRIRLISDVPLGALLSGGVDSSLIVALMSRISSEKVKTFTIGFDEKKYDEVSHARKVADLLGVEHHVEICRPADLDEMLLRTVRQFGEPFADDSSMATIMLSSAARKHVTVALNGDGGDELACGYTSYTHAKVATRFHRLHPLGAPSEEAVWALFDDPSLAGALRRKLVYSYLRPELKHLMRRVRQFHLYRKRLYKQGSLESVDLRTFRWHLDLAQRSYRFADNPVERLLWIDNIHSLPNMLLVKADIGSMAYGLEVRSPLLDHVLVEKLARIPFSLKIKGGEPKYLLKKLAERYLPKDILYRRKQGFSMPVASWLRGPAVPLAQEAFAQAAPFLDRFLARTELEVLLEEHVSGKRNHKNILWNLLNLALWAVDRGA